MARIHTGWAVTALALAVIAFWLGRAQTTELRARVEALERENRFLTAQLSRFQTPEQFDIEANERGVLRALRAVNTALVMAFANAPSGGYPATLSELGPQGQSVLDSNVAGGNAAGYRITYAPAVADAHGIRVSYELSARPVRYQETGRRSFFSDESGLIRATTEARAASKSDPTL